VSPVVDMTRDVDRAAVRRRLNRGTMRDEVDASIVVR